MAMAAISTITGAFYTARQPKIYRATSTVFINDRAPQRIDKFTEAMSHDYGASAERFVNAQVAFMTSRQVAERTALRLKLRPEALAGKLFASVDKSTQIATLAVEDADPAMAQRLANAFTDTYEELITDDRTPVAVEAAKFLEEQAGSLRNKVEDDEKELYKFVKSKELPGSNFEESHKIQSADLASLHDQYSKIRSDGIRMRAELQEVEAAKGDQKLLRELVLSDGGGRWQELHTQYIELKLDIAKLETHYGANYPKLIEAQQTLDALQKELDEELRTATNALRARARVNASELSQIKSALDEETKRASALREGELEYNRLKRRFDEARDGYDSTSRRQHDTELQSLARQTYVRRVDSASLPHRPIKPNWRISLFYSFVLGILLGIGLVLLSDLRDEKLETIIDVERNLRQPLLGVLTKIPIAQSITAPDSMELARADYVVRHPRSGIAEQCQQISTNVFSSFLTPPRAIMVVSASTGEGKTMLAVNLATAICARGKRVLLIDGDLRKGRLHKLFQVPQTNGLFEVVTQRIPLAEGICRTSVPNLDVVTTGDVLPHVSPLRIFELSEFVAVVEEWKKMYDLVIFDTAPAALVTDAHLVGRVVDGAVGVVRGQLTSSRMVRRVADQFEMNKIPLIGWVLNGVSQQKNYYSYQYGYGYRKDPGYYTDPTPEEVSGSQPPDPPLQN